MGFSTGIAFIILFIGAVILGIELVTSYGDYILITNKASLEKTQRSLSELNTEVKIVEVIKGNPTKIYVENSGTTTLDPDYVFLVLDNKWVPQENYSITGLGYISEAPSNKTKLVKGAFYDGSTLYLTTRDTTWIKDSSGLAPDELYGIVGWYNITLIEKSFISTNTSDEFYWQPGDVIEITVDYPVSTKVKVITETGVGDTYYINSGHHHEHLLPAEDYSYAWVY